LAECLSIACLCEAMYDLEILVTLANLGF